MPTDSARRRSHYKAEFRHLCGISAIYDLESRSEVIQGKTFWPQSKARVGLLFYTGRL